MAQLLALHSESPRERRTAVLNRSLLLKVTLWLINKRRETPITYFKPKQSQCILAVASGKDLLAILPTGYGKSLIFEAVPIYQSVLHKDEKKTIVISPLNVIIEQQLAGLGRSALRVKPVETDSFCEDSVIMEDDLTKDESATSATSSSTKQYSSSLKQGNFTFLLGHPEEILSKTTMETMRTSKWTAQVSTVVIDEAHCVVQWSTDFRPKYRDIEQLKAIFPAASFIALTATASIRMRKDILRLLNMEDATVISGQVDRVNIKYQVKKRPSYANGVETSYTSVFVPIMNELKAKGGMFPKTVIYTALKWCGIGNEVGVRILSSGKLSLAGVPQIAQFHAPLSPEAKKAVADEMASSEGDLRLLLATEAYGMGVDTPDVRRILHAGPPCTLETYMQTTGRAGRDGADSEATLFWNNEDLGKQIVTPEVKTFCRLETCRRDYLSQYFGTTPLFSGPLHRCCDNCALKCDCDECFTLSASDFECLALSPDTGVVSNETPNHNDNTELIVFDALLQVFNDINTELGFEIDPALFSGLTVPLATDIAAHYELFQDEEYLQMNYFHLNPSYIDTIYCVVCICQNIPVSDDQL